MKQLQDSLGQTNMTQYASTEQKPQLVYSEPGHYAANRLTYFKVGPERDRRQYDHSITGPVVDRSKYQLRREFNQMGASLRMLNGDVRPEFKPTPMHRHF